MKIKIIIVNSVTGMTPTGMYFAVIETWYDGLGDHARLTSWWCEGFPYEILFTNTLLAFVLRFGRGPQLFE